MAEAPRILLEHHLKRLKLPTFLREYEKLARQCATEGLDHVQFLARLVEMEMIDRERRLVERRIRQARFPVVKQLESFDFKAIPSLNKMLVLDLARGDYIDRRENAILLGPSGVGKTHVALAFGLAACQKGLSVRFTTASQLVHEMIEARDEKRLLRLQDQLARVSLLIVDELGYAPVADRKRAAVRRLQPALRKRRHHRDLQPALPGMDDGLRQRAPHRRAARPHHPPFRNRPARRRKLSTPRGQGAGRQTLQGPLAPYRQIPFIPRTRTMDHQPPPLITVPLDLSDEAAAKLIDFLYEFAHRLESHYSQQLYRYHNAIDERQADLWSDTDPPF